MTESSQLPCKLGLKLEDALLEYYFGTIDDERRLEVEEKLLTSRSFLTEFIALKRTLELTGDLSVVPSTSLKKRLRESIRQSFSRDQRMISLWFDQLRGIEFTGRLVVGAAILIMVLGSAFVWRSSLHKVTPLRQMPLGQSYPQKERLVDSAGDLTASAHYL